MRFLKGLAVGLFGFLLLVSLPVLGLAITVNSTLLNPGFLKQEVKQIDIQSVAQGFLKDNIQPEMEPYLKNSDSLIADIKPWLYQQTDYVIDSGYRYLKRSSGELNLDIETATIKPVVIDWVTKTYLSTLTADQIKTLGINQISDGIKQGIEQALPPSFKLNRDSLGEETMLALVSIQKAIGIWQTSFNWLCVLTALLIVLMVLVLRKIKDILRWMGIISLIPGVLGVPVYFLLLYLPKYLPLQGIPEALNTWITQLSHDLVAPWGIYSAVLLMIGLAMLIPSFFIKKTSIKKTDGAFN